MFYWLKIFAEKLFDKFIWPQLAPPPNKNLATALLLGHSAITIILKYCKKNYTEYTHYSYTKYINTICILYSLYLVDAVDCGQDVFWVFDAFPYLAYS